MAAKGRLPLTFSIIISCNLSLAFFAVCIYRCLIEMNNKKQVFSKSYLCPFYRRERPYPQEKAESR